MSNDLIKSLIGAVCNITTGSFGGASFSKVKVIGVVDNWIKIEDGKGQINLVNTDYITNIKVLPGN